jgi:hypothetical protein
MQISLLLTASFLALSVAINAAPAVDDLNSHIRVRQNNLQPRTPRPGNCLGGRCLDPSRPPLCYVKFYRQPVYPGGNPQGVSPPTSRELNKMVRHCKSNCRCSPGAEGRTLELSCSAEAGEDCRGLCLCPNLRRSPSTAMRASNAANANAAMAISAANSANAMNAAMMSAPPPMMASSAGAGF